MRPLKTYQLLAKECDLFFNRVQHKYPDSLACKSGCYDCCICGSVFAIEAYFIARFWLKNRTLAAPRSHGPDYCPFLAEGKCLIYQVRPMMCRTHGLALATLKDDCLDWNSCHRNFQKGLPADFEPNDFLPMDRLTEDLALLNIHFSRQLDLSSEHERISLRSLYSAPHTFVLSLK